LKIHEYQAKQVLARFGVAVPEGRVADTADQAEAAYDALDSQLCVVKAQIHAGGRGKGGGVKLVRSAAEARAAADAMLGKPLITHQTGPEGKIVNKVWVEKGSDIARELYLAVTIDRAQQRVVMMASSEGGTEIEEVAAKTPEKIYKETIDPGLGMMPNQARKLAFKLGLTGDAFKNGVKIMLNLARAFHELDCSIAEINPLVVTTGDQVLALDGKMNFDGNSLFRHADIVELRDLTEEDPKEVEASKFELSYIALEGNIGCMVNGAGLAMATLDVISVCGGTPANFLDAGGDADKDKVRDAFKLILLDPKVKAILVNIFGGIVRCDLIAEGVVAAASELGLEVPLVVRLQGNSAAEGRAILADSGLNITPVETLREAGEAAVAAARVAGR